MVAIQILIGMHQTLEYFDLFKYEAFYLCLCSPNVKYILMLDLFLLVYEAPQDHLIVLKVEELHAKLQRHL